MGKKEAEIRLRGHHLVPWSPGQGGLNICPSPQVKQQNAPVVKETGYNCEHQLASPSHLLGPGQPHVHLSSSIFFFWARHSPVPPQLPSHMCPFCLESLLRLSSFTELVLSFQNNSGTVSLGRPSTHPGKIRLPYPRLYSCCILVHLSLLPDNGSLKVGILIKRNKSRYFVLF